MKESRDLMGMPITIEVLDPEPSEADIEQAYAYLQYVDETFSTYKETSEISRINAGQLEPEQYSTDMKNVLAQCEQTKQETEGFFDIAQDGQLDPSGYVKGWAIQNVAQQLADKGLHNYYVDAGGDMQVSGYNAEGQPWIVGIRNPFNRDEIVKRVSLQDCGMATSGTYIRGEHIYNPRQPDQKPQAFVSLTVIGPNIVDADRYATAAFAMGKAGMMFLARLNGFEAYAIDPDGIATFTPGFTRYVLA